MMLSHCTLPRDSATCYRNKGLFLCSYECCTLIKLSTSGATLLWRPSSAPWSVWYRIESRQSHRGVDRSVQRSIEQVRDDRVQKLNETIHLSFSWSVGGCSAWDRVRHGVKWRTAYYKSRACDEQRCRLAASQRKPNVAALHGWGCWATMIYDHAEMKQRQKLSYWCILAPLYLSIPCMQDL